MAKFELPIYNFETEKVEKTYKKNFMPVSLYIRFQKFSEEVVANKVKSDEEMFLMLKDLFLETFPELTEDEYLNKTDIGQILLMFRDILDKSTKFDEGDSKNA